LFISQRCERRKHNGPFNYTGTIYPRERHALSYIREIYSSALVILYTWNILTFKLTQIGYKTKPKESIKHKQ